MAWAFQQADKPYEGFATYYDWLRAEYTRKRAVLLEGMRAAGVQPVEPTGCQGSFFIMAATDNIALPEEFKDGSEQRRHAPRSAAPPSAPTCGAGARDYSMCRWWTQKIGVACIPPSAFYCEAHKPLAFDMVRLAFCKEDAELREAGKRFQQLPSARKQ